MTPHADSLWVDEIQGLQALERGNGIDCVPGGEVRAGRLALRPSVTSVVNLEDHKAVPRQIINVSDIAFCGLVGSWWYVPVIEDNRLEAILRRFRVGDCQQAMNLVAFRDVADEVLLIEEGVWEFFLECDLTSTDLEVPQIRHGDFIPDFEDNFRRRRGPRLHLRREGGCDSALRRVRLRQGSGLLGSDWVDWNV